MASLTGCWHSTCWLLQLLLLCFSTADNSGVRSTNLTQPHRRLSAEQQACQVLTLDSQSWSSAGLSSTSILDSSNASGSGSPSQACYRLPFPRLAVQGPGNQVAPPATAPAATAAVVDTEGRVAAVRLEPGSELQLQRVLLLNSLLPTPTLMASGLTAAAPLVFDMGQAAQLTLRNCTVHVAPCSSLPGFVAWLGSSAAASGGSSSGTAAGGQEADAAAGSDSQVVAGNFTRVDSFSVLLHSLHHGHVTMQDTLLTCNSSYSLGSGSGTGSSSSNDLTVVENPPLIYVDDLQQLTKAVQIASDVAPARITIPASGLQLSPSTWPSSLRINTSPVVIQGPSGSGSRAVLDLNQTRYLAKLGDSGAISFRDLALINMCQGNFVPSGGTLLIRYATVTNFWALDYPRSLAHLTMRNVTLLVGIDEFNLQVSGRVMLEIGSIFPRYRGTATSAAQRGNYENVVQLNATHYTLSETVTLAFLASGLTWTHVMPQEAAALGYTAKPAEWCSGQSPSSLLTPVPLNLTSSALGMWRFLRNASALSGVAWAVQATDLAMPATVLLLDSVVDVAEVFTSQQPPGSPPLSLGVSSLLLGAMDPQAPGGPRPCITLGLGNATGLIRLLHVDKMHMYLVNLVLTGLAVPTAPAVQAGDEVVEAPAPGPAAALWAFEFNRTVSRLHLHNCTLVLPQSEFIDWLAAARLGHHRGDAAADHNDDDHIDDGDDDDDDGDAAALAAAGRALQGLEALQVSWARPNSIGLAYLQGWGMNGSDIVLLPDVPLLLPPPQPKAGDNHGVQPPAAHHGHSGVPAWVVAVATVPAAVAAAGTVAVAVLYYYYCYVRRLRLDLDRGRLDPELGSDPKGGHRTDEPPGNVAAPCSQQHSSQQHQGSSKHCSDTGSKASCKASTKSKSSMKRLGGATARPSVPSAPASRASRRALSIQGGRGGAQHSMASSTDGRHDKENDHDDDDSNDHEAVADDSSSPRNSQSSQLLMLVEQRAAARHSGPGHSPPGAPRDLNDEVRVMIEALHSQGQGPGLREDSNQLELLEQVGEGGFGMVHRGIWRGLEVAVKTVLFQDKRSPPSTGGPEAAAPGGQCRENAEGAIRQQVLREAAVCSSVWHPNVVATYHYHIAPVVAVQEPLGSGGLRVHEGRSATQDYKLYMVQELCDASLAQVLQQGLLHHPGTVPPKPKWSYAIPFLLHVAKGLAYLHSRNIVHGDLTPGNVLLKLVAKAPAPSQEPQPPAESGVRGVEVYAKITDFGLCQVLDPQKTHVSNHHQGTPFYVAPELALDHKLTKASDVFAFGILAWEVVTNQRPWVFIGGRSAVCNPKSGRLPRGKPSLLQDLIARCLAGRPEHRPTTDHCVAVMEQLLQRVIVEAGEGYPNPTPAEWPAQPAAAAAAASVLGAIPLAPGMPGVPQPAVAVVSPAAPDAGPTVPHPPGADAAAAASSEPVAWAVPPARRRSSRLGDDDPRSMELVGLTSMTGQAGPGRGHHTAPQ